MATLKDSESRPAVGRCRSQSPPVATENTSIMANEVGSMRPNPYIFDIENRKKRKPRLAHDLGAGAKCNKCGDKCSGFELHFWRHASYDPAAAISATPTAATATATAAAATAAATASANAATAPATFEFLYRFEPLRQEDVDSSLNHARGRSSHDLKIKLNPLHDLKIKLNPLHDLKVKLNPLYDLKVK
ncbi:uncharacterized protein [Palaemon carinicauda]|uniref:uncharacterized protein isoform X1 n=1 Tax=Palaemon carinicauda TaxID=392227 RepID=UPI0035B5FC90